MPLVRCPHCGEDTFAITGWADLDHCANCGRPLAQARVVERAAVEIAWRRREAAPRPAPAGEPRRRSRPGSLR
ncbi:MAG TPA: hypothetical protein VIL04_05590 [Solirubrobacterales bacterium]